MLDISKRLQQISESQTVALTSLLLQMKRDGQDVVSLGAGEPDFQTPSHVKRAGIQAIKSDDTKYTAVSGIFELRQAITNWIEQEYGARYTPDNIVVTCGAKHAIYQSLMAICDPGDEILVPAPYWVSYPEQIKLAGGIFKPLWPDTHDLKITAAHLEKVISSTTKVLILNSPTNPTGAVYSKRELDDIAGVIAQSGIFVISDEIYDQIVYDAPFASLAVYDNIREQLVYVNGVSKSFAMTGWRIGFAAADKRIAAAIVKYQGHSMTHPATISQRAAQTAYQSEKNFIKEMLAAYQKRRDYVMQRLSAMPHVKCAPPQGTFYAFPEVSSYYNRDMGINDSMALCYYLLQHSGVAIVPGAAFGMDAHVRLSFATSMNTLEMAFDRLESGLQSLL